MSYQVAFRLLALRERYLMTYSGPANSKLEALDEVIDDLRAHGLIPRGQRWRTADGDVWFGPPPDAPHDTIMIRIADGQARRRQYVERDCGPMEPLDAAIELD